MNLPNQERAQIDQRKLTDYLLNRNHPDAKGKSRFFCAHYGRDWERLRDDLLEHAAGPATDLKETRHGTIYVIEGMLAGAPVRSVWMVRLGESHPRFVTAYPIGS